MIETWALWLFIVGLIAGGVITWLAMVRLPRGEDDVSAAERPAEAAWISRVIERGGGVAPVSLVEEVLDLHQAYLSDPRHAQVPVSWVPVSPAAPMTAGYPGMPPGTAQPPMPGGPPAPAGWSAPPGPVPPAPGWSPPPAVPPSAPRQGDPRRAP
jgi:hypothetical protein